MPCRFGARRNNQGRSGGRAPRSSAAHRPIVLAREASSSPWVAGRAFIGPLMLRFWPCFTIALSSLTATLTANVAQAGGALLFDERADALGEQTMCNPAGCYTNYLRVTDIDGDADLDLLFPNYVSFFGPGDAEP